MKKHFISIILAAMSLASCGNAQTSVPQSSSTDDGSQKELRDKSQNSKKGSGDYEISITHQGDSANIIKFLSQASELPAGTNVPMFFARKFLGKPYVAHTLDQNKEEKLVINTQGVDCTTFVENVVALTICARKGIVDFQKFCDVLAHVRYIDGKVGYTTRQHYFTTWMKENVREGLLEKITLPDPPLSANRIPHVNYMTTHVESYKMLNAHREWLPQIKAMEDSVSHTSFQFIPKEQLKDSKKYREYVQDGDVIAIVTNKAGLDISHVGLAIWHDDGLHLFNASSLQKKVVDDSTTLYQYLLRQKSSAGIAVVRIK